MIGVSILLDSGEKIWLSCEWVSGALAWLEEVLRQIKLELERTCRDL